MIYSNLLIIFKNDINMYMHLIDIDINFKMILHYSYLRNGMKINWNMRWNLDDLFILIFLNLIRNFVFILSGNMLLPCLKIMLIFKVEVIYNRLIVQRMLNNYFASTFLLINRQDSVFFNFLKMFTMTFKINIIIKIIKKWS